MEFLIQNPLFLLAAVLVVLAFLAKIISKPNKKKNAENKPAEAKVDKTEKVDVPAEEEQVVQTETVQEEVKKEKKKKLRRLKPEITKVYEKKELQPTDDSKNKILEEKSQKEEEILKSMQFVKSSKNVERLKPLTASEIEERERLRLEQELLAQETEQFDILEEKVDLENKSTHFDRTRRLSKMIKEDSFDDMFCSHISEKYMNMNDLEKHIRNCDEIQSKLFNRVAETIVNSEIRLTNDTNGNNNERNLQLDEIEKRRREQVSKFLKEINESSEEEEYDFDELVEEDVDLSARNILIVDAILKRKGRKNNS